MTSDTPPVEKGHSTLTGNIGAHGLNQVANFAIQIAIVPILASFWGLESYGVWLVLFTIPFYLLVGDFGLGWVAANDMTAAVAQDRREDAAATFRAVQVGLIALETLTLGIAWWLASGPLNHLLGFAQGAADGEAVTAVMLIVGYGLATQQMVLAQAGMRAAGGYSTAIHVMTAVTVLETATLLLAVAGGATIVHAAAIYCVGHVVGLVWLRWVLHRRAPWLRLRGGRPAVAELRRLAKPAAAMTVLPVCFALAMQSPVLVLGAVAGAAAVPAFAAVRTLSRAAVQVANIVSTAAMPQFTVATARGEHGRQAELFALTLATSVALLVPAAAGLVLFGRWFMDVWTGGLIEPSLALIATLALAMLLNGTWVPISNLILASNQHARFSYVFLAASLGSIGITILLAESLGALGAALAAVALDTVMLIWIAVLSYRLGMVDKKRLRAAPETVAAMVRRSLAARGILGNSAP